MTNTPTVQEKPPEGEGKVVEHCGNALEQAEQILAEARGELHEAEKELIEAVAKEHGAVAKIEEAEHKISEELAHDSKIIVNGRTRSIEGHKISFEEVVHLAFPSGPPNPNTLYAVTFRNAAQVPAMDELYAGQSVKVKRGNKPINETVFNVSETIRS